jgi:DNA invertase Pin-like site-specific DNA recombinase
MTRTSIKNAGLLADWISRRPSAARSTRQRKRTDDDAGGLRFALYGRISTREFQDRGSSLSWQREAARELITGHGAIVAEFFDVGCSRRRSWHTRPQAAALLATLTHPDRAFDAIVVGEYERAFAGDQLLNLIPLFHTNGVQLWLPEANGPIDADNPTHEAIIVLLGAQSKREVLRSRFRTVAAMQAQVRDQGRYMGGRPPYGYRLVDAGPHPNAAHARWGRRLQRLEPDPATAPHVRWMFAQRLTGRSVAGIARALNDNDIACPSGVDPARNRHRSAAGWTLRTVAAILANPRYTGRQVWNRQRTDREPVDASSGGRDDREVMRWNQAQDWVISTRMAHPGLVSEPDFIAAQAIRAARPTGDGATRRYLLAGLVICGRCGRRMDAHWVNGRPGYRCRHGRTSAKPPANGHPKTLYRREDHLLADLTGHIDPGVTSLDGTELARHLRSNEMAIICDDVSCTVSSQAPVAGPSQSQQTLW